MGFRTLFSVKCHQLDGSYLKCYCVIKASWNEIQRWDLTFSGIFLFRYDLDQ